MAPHRVDLRDHGDAQGIRDLGGGDGRPEAGAAAPHDDDVVSERLQRHLPGESRGPFYRLTPAGVTDRPVPPSTDRGNVPFHVVELRSIW